VGTLEARSRNAVTALIGVVLVWSLASLTLPRADIGSLARGPADTAWVGSITDLAAIASDRPTTTLDARRSEHPHVIPSVLSAEAMTRSALLWLTGDVRFPASLIALSLIAAGVLRRGPPFASTS
jgi:hypothetical protein